MVIDAWAASGFEIAGDVELEGDLFLCENFEELGISLGGEGVTDTLCPYVDGGPDALGAVTAVSPGMRGEAQAGNFGFGVGVAE